MDNKIDEKRFNQLFIEEQKATKNSNKELKICLYKNCKNLLTKKKLKNIAIQYNIDKKKKCNKLDFKCGFDFFNDSNYKKALDEIEKCTNDYCLNHSYKILKDSNNFFIKIDTLNVKKFKCLKEYLISKDISKKNIDKYVKKCKLANKQELLYDLEIFQNDVKLIDQKIKELKQRIKSKKKNCVDLDKKIKKYKPKTIKKSIKKNISKKSKKLR